MLRDDAIQLHPTRRTCTAFYELAINGLYIDYAQNAVLYIALAANFIPPPLLNLLTKTTSSEEPTNADMQGQHMVLKGLGVEGTSWRQFVS